MDLNNFQLLHLHQLATTCSGWTFLCLEFWCLERTCLDLHSFSLFSHLNPLFESSPSISRIKTSTAAVDSTSLSKFPHQLPQE